MTTQRESNRRSGSSNKSKGRMISGALLITILLSTPSTDAAVGESKEAIARATAVEGKTAEIPCHVTSSDRVLLTLWYKDMTGMPIYSYDARDKTTRSWVDERVLGSRATFVPDSVPPYLKLEDVKESDGGIYTCRVDYKKSPTQRAKANLSIIIPPGSPTILQEDGTQVDGVMGPYDEGTFFNITCQVIGGQPPPQVTWWQGKDLLDGEIDNQAGAVYRNALTLGPLTRDHLNAFYVCQAINTDKIDPPSKGVTLDVNFKPLTVEVLGSGQPLTSGMQYEVTCKSTGARPPALITWWMEGKELTNATSHTENLGNVTLSTLTLVPDAADGGKLLKCLAQSPVIDHQPIEDSWKLDIQWISPPHIFPITPILGVLIGVVGALVLVAIVVVVVMKLRADSLRAKDPPDSSLKVPHAPLQHTKDGDDGPDVILCRTDPTYEDVDGIPQKLKHANIYETVPYDSNDRHSKNSESCCSYAC